MHPFRFSPSFSYTSLAATVVASFLACGGDPVSEADGGSDGDPNVDAGGELCAREPRAPNASRFVVVSRPYGEGGTPATEWQVLALSAEGDLQETDTTFSMRRATGGVVAFTPDGELGIVPQDDGSLGIFQISEAGEVTVLHEAFAGDFFAGSVVMREQGTAAYVLSTNWRENGGGIYRISIGCDNSITDEGLVVAAKLPRGLVSKGNGDMVIAANDLGDTPLEQEVHLVLDDSLATPVASTTLFPDRDAIVGSTAITSDETFVLVGDTSGFSGVPNRVGIARLGADSLQAVQVLSPLEDPQAIATSPFDNAAIVVSGFGNAIHKLTYDPMSNDAPFVVAGELPYTGETPQLPGDLVQIQRGDLLGLVLIGEVEGLRRVRFEGNGDVTDLGLTALGEGFGTIVGALGVQP